MNKRMFAVCGPMALLIVVAIAARAETPERREASVETKQLWDKLLTALETSDFKAALPLATQFNDVKDVTEPVQKLFVANVIDVLTLQPVAVVKDEKPNVDIDVANLTAQKAAEEARLPGLQEKVERAKNRKRPKVRFGPITIPTDDSDQLKNAEEAVADCRDKIARLATQLGKVQGNPQPVPVKAVTRGDKLSLLFTQLLEVNDYRAVLAFTNMYTKLVGPTQEITRVELLVNKVRSANEFACGVAEKIKGFMAEHKLWTAEAERTKAGVNYPSMLTLCNRAFDQISKDLAIQITEATKKRDVVFEAAQRDAVDGQKRFDAFLADYPDYPNAGQDKIKLADIHKDQVDRKLEKTRAMIKEVSADDPVEAAKMIERLLATETDPDVISVIQSKLVALKRDCLKCEVDQIKKDIDDAQKDLTTFEATYSTDLKSDKVNAAMTENVSVGVKNLVRARSKQEGAISQLEMLIKEQTDNVTKSKLVGLRDTAKAAVAQIDMNGTALAQMNARLEGQTQNARMLTIAAIVGGLLLLLGVIAVVLVVVMKRKKATAP